MSTKRIKQPNVHRQRIEIAIKYFNKHPHALGFERDVTPLERKVFDFPPGTKVGVFKTARGVIAHAYSPPETRLN